MAYLNPRPWTPGSVILESSTPGGPGGSIFHLNQSEYLSWLLGARTVAELLCDRLGVRRCALVSRPHRERPAQVRIPLCSFSVSSTHSLGRSLQNEISRLIHIFFHNRFVSSHFTVWRQNGVLTSLQKRSTAPTTRASAPPKVPLDGASLT